MCNTVQWETFKGENFTNFTVLWLFAQVFSLESFPLYSSTLIFIFQHTVPHEVKVE